MTHTDYPGRIKPMEMLIENKVLAILIILWTLVWKGIALWHSAGNKQKVWYILILVLNTMGFLEIIYLILLRRKSNGTKEK